MTHDLWNGVRPLESRDPKPARQIFGALIERVRFAVDSPLEGALRENSPFSVK